MSKNLIDPSEPVTYEQDYDKAYVMALAADEEWEEMDEFNHSFLYGEYYKDSRQKNMDEAVRWAGIIYDTEFSTAFLNSWRSQDITPSGLASKSMSVPMYEALVQNYEEALGSLTIYNLLIRSEMPPALRLTLEDFAKGDKEFESKLINLSKNSNIAPQEIVSLYTSKYRKDVVEPEIRALNRTKLLLTDILSGRASDPEYRVEDNPNYTE